MAETLKVLYVGLKYDYGDPRRGFSYEYVNFFGTLSRMQNVRMELFAFDEVLKSKGRKLMNQALIDQVVESKPDLCFFVLFTDEIAKETIRFLSEKGKTTTLNWFCDDHWRFHSFSKYWAPWFNWVVTTDSVAAEEYHRYGLKNVIRSQWGFNHFLLAPYSIVPDLDISFVGQVHSSRRATIERLEQAGVAVQCWGKGWDHGMLDHDAMVQMFLRSKVNLNFAESSYVPGIKPLAKIFLNRRSDNTFQMNSLSQMAGNIRSLAGRRRVQIKARNFEIPGYGGFLLTPTIEGLEEYYAPDKELASFTSFQDLLDKIRYYLKHEDEREQIRLAGHKRTLQSHTYEKRFTDIFESIALR
jgi:spore maturation protein CgeB